MQQECFKKITLGLMAIVALALSASACGESHRNEDFCSVVCACAPSGAEESCALSCTSELNQVEAQTGISPVSDECFACVQTATCSRIELACERTCGFDDLDDDTSPSDPQPGEF